MRAKEKKISSVCPSRQRKPWDGNLPEYVLNASLHSLVSSACLRSNVLATTFKWSSGQWQRCPTIPSWALPLSPFGRNVGKVYWRNTHIPSLPDQSSGVMLVMVVMQTVGVRWSNCEGVPIEGFQERSLEFLSKWSCSQDLGMSCNYAYKLWKKAP